MLDAISNRPWSCWCFRPFCYSVDVRGIGANIVAAHIKAGEGTVSSDDLKEVHGAKKLDHVVADIQTCQCRIGAETIR